MTIREASSRADRRAPYLSAALVAAGALAGSPAFAQDAAVKWTCHAATDTLVIEYVPSLADAPPAFEQAKPLEFYSLLEVEESQIVDSREHKADCTLGKVRIDMTFAPQAPNVNLLGLCGAALTGSVVLVRDGVEILPETLFEDIKCHERERYVASITVRRTGKPVLKYVPIQ